MRRAERLCCVSLERHRELQEKQSRFAICHGSSSFKFNSFSLPCHKRLFY
uniref:Uncharacterized protein LOC105136633 isoform X2 n=1 Tax=Rhizophora mucronata TaxID=61149 RepID=A0A2P2L8W8_RHIMU